MDQIRVLSVSIVQLDSSDTPSVRIHVASKDPAVPELHIRRDVPALPFGADLREWARTALLAAVDEL